MSKRAIFARKEMGKVSVGDLLSLIPEELLDRLGEESLVDSHVKKLFGKSFFKLLLYSILSKERLSLRDIACDVKDPIFQGFSPELADQVVGWTGIRDRLIHIKVDYIERIYLAFLEKAQGLYGQKALRPYHIQRYDSTMIKVFSHLLSGMKVGNTSKNKHQVKLTTEYIDDFSIRMQFYNDQGHLSEEKALQEVIKQRKHGQEDIVVFDNGLKSRATLRDFDQEGIQFVTNLGKNPRYELLHPYEVLCQDEPDLEFIQDSKVYLFESGQAKATPHAFRLIEFRVTSKGKKLFLLTNLWHLPASTIALCYLLRWDIEVLFRFLKQEMNLTHFVSNELNAIQVMVYIKLIATILILIYKKQNQISTYKRAKREFFQELTLNILIEMVEDEQKRNWFLQKAHNFLKKE